MRRAGKIGIARGVQRRVRWEVLRRVLLVAFVHHVYRQPALRLSLTQTAQHPLARVIGDELHVGALADPQRHRVHRHGLRQRVAV